MCNTTCVQFVENHLDASDVSGLRVLELGARYVNGSVRPAVERLKPAEYVGVDIEAGRGVDVICRVEDIESRFGPESFDVVISTELLEHLRDWRGGIRAIKAVCRPGGTIVISTRSKGFPYHAFPYDFWRYELSDMRVLFSDCEIMSLENDPLDPGVLIKARKPANASEPNLSDYELHSIVHGRRVREISDSDLAWSTLLRVRVEWVFRSTAQRLVKLLQPSFR